MSVGKYWDEIKGSYGVYAISTARSEPIIFYPAPARREWLNIQHLDNIKYMQVRFSWRAIQPTREGAYDWSQVDQLMRDAGEFRKFFRIEIHYVNNSVAISRLRSSDPAVRLSESPVPAYIFNSGFNINPNLATGDYGGGCYLFTSDPPAGVTPTYKLWPRLWVPAVYTAFANMLEALLLHIRQDPNGARWFQGIQITEIGLQGLENVKGNTAFPLLNHTQDRAFDGYTHFTDRIAEIWNEPLHSIYANWGFGGPAGVLSRQGARSGEAWLDKCCLEQGFGYGHPDTWYLERSRGICGNPLSNETGATDLKRCASMGGIGAWAYQKYQTRGIIIQSTQRSGTNCLYDASAEPPGPKMLLDYARGALLLDGKSPKANLFVCETGINKDRTKPTSWGAAEYLALVQSGKYPLRFEKTNPVFHNANRGASPDPGLIIPSNLTFSGSNITWNYTTVAALRGFWVWVSATQGGPLLSGTTRFESNLPSLRSSTLSRLNPPTTTHWICVQARGDSAHSPVAAIQFTAAPVLATPSQVCANFGDQTITWAYTNAASTPVVMFHIYVDGALVAYSGPTRRSITWLRSAWTNATQHVVKVEAVGARSATEKTLTFTYANQTTGASCTA